MSGQRQDFYTVKCNVDNGMYEAVKYDSKEDKYHYIRSFHWEMDAIKHALERARSEGMMFMYKKTK